MRFLLPIALAGLATLILPVAIHLLVRRRAKPIDFPTLRFLRATRSHQWVPRRIQQPLLLALRLIALALLVAGLAHPFLSRAAVNGKLTVILLDASFSMRAGTRVDAAREQARTIINHLAPNDRAAVIAFDTNPVKLGEPTSDRAVLLDAVNRYQPGYGSGDYAGAVRAAKDMLIAEAQPAGEVALISDFQLSGLHGEANLSESIKTIDARVVPLAIGRPLDQNSYWTDLRVAPIPVGPVLSAALVSQDGDDVSATRREWRLDAPQGDRPDIAWHTEVGGQIVGQLRSATPDGFAADDTYSFAIGSLRPRGTLLIADQTDATTYLRAALTTGTQGAPIEPEVKNELPDPATLDQYALIVMTLQGSPAPVVIGALTGYAERGGTVWLCAGADLNTDAWNKIGASDTGNRLPFVGMSRIDGSAALRLGIADPAAPPVEDLYPADRIDLRSVPIRSGFALTTVAGSSVVMRWSNGLPAMVQRSVGSGSIIVMGTSPERAATGLGLSNVFPQLAASILKTASGSKQPLSLEIGESMADAVTAGQKIEVEPPSGGKLVVTGREVVKNPAAVFPEPGKYQISVNGQSHFVALNPPAVESETALADPELIKAVFTVGAGNGQIVGTNGAVDAQRGNSWWRWLIGLAALLLFAEWFVSLRGSGAAEASPVSLPTQPSSNI